MQVPVENDACPFSLDLAGELPPGVGQLLAVLGTRIPKQIETGGQGSARVPGITVGMDATAAGSLSVSAFDVDILWMIPAVMTRVEFDERPVLGRSAIMDPSERRLHRLVVSCR